MLELDHQIFAIQAHRKSLLGLVPQIFATLEAQTSRPEPGHQRSGLPKAVSKWQLGSVHRISASPKAETLQLVPAPRISELLELLDGANERGEEAHIVPIASLTDVFGLCEVRVVIHRHVITVFQGARGSASLARSTV